MPKPQKYRDVVKFLRSQGWVLLRQGKGSHELWGLPDESVKEIVPRHSEVSAGVIQQLIKKLPETPREWR
ncbi:type II toxin-antitoxin system HicA family toxin [Rathayibacter rathayi]|uniref:Type II toxin-antitoxin system HicA family toxin n=1 Tax=Rathayibacter rathayi TaxID=33887 RepID=A0ABX5AAZ9_RATRA|nr:MULTISPECIES: type II toxin-antitoxin system HicA family toxin [Rathayibacter]MWV76040.1 addiction module toxin, HicA family [Rathayibacter rathayi NCPPB 2980 = VKM Ac-1601]PPF24646.1 type II toxin-antitoxin system HicA family toxin [Rathayibacter tritici]PPG65101.1 type II toxin-antitoxin system HicA family toxin [Rathayibacter rathayi]PPG65146.1 type II toxin-antitoxin system HicA family toxin [Rathayibacter rathayi]PPG73894.1 type II toxin-antitoxin system HicA family toxin [Rathayibacte